MRLQPFLLPSRVLCGALCGAAALAQSQTVTLTSAKDNTLYFSATGALSNGSGEGMFSGMSAAGEARRALVAFDLSGIPPGSVVTAASLQLTVVQTSATAGTMSLHLVLADWGEGASIAASGGGGGGAAAASGDATWLHTFHPGAFWASQGGDFAPAASASVAVPGIGVHTWTSTPQLVADVQGWVDAPPANFGWLVLTPEGATDRPRRFATREATNAAQRPQLTVTFSLAPPASFLGFGPGCAGSAGVPVLAPVGGSVPALGSALQLALTNVPAATPFAIGVLGFSATLNANGLGTYPLPFDLSALGMTGCLQLASADATVVLGASGGSAAWAIGIPVLGGLVGFELYVQALVPDAGTNPFGAVTSTAGQGVIGS
jgi:hypothetical protein